MELWAYNTAIGVLAFVTALAAFGGEKTRGGDVTLVRRLTTVGWITLVAASLTLVAVIARENAMMADRARSAKERFAVEEEARALRADVRTANARLERMRDTLTPMIAGIMGEIMTLARQSDVSAVQTGLAGISQQLDGILAEVRTSGGDPAEGRVPRAAAERKSTPSEGALDSGAPTTDGERSTSQGLPASSGSSRVAPVAPGSETATRTGQRDDRLMGRGHAPTVPFAPASGGSHDIDASVPTVPREPATGESHEDRAASAPQLLSVDPLP
jgi:hypothetical protein